MHREVSKRSVEGEPRPPAAPAHACRQRERSRHGSAPSARSTCGSGMGARLAQWPRKSQILRRGGAGCGGSAEGQREAWTGGPTATDPLQHSLCQAAARCGQGQVSCAARLRHVPRCERHCSCLQHRGTAQRHRKAQGGGEQGEAASHQGQPQEDTPDPRGLRQRFRQVGAKRQRLQRQQRTAHQHQQPAPPAGRQGGGR